MKAEIKSIGFTSGQKLQLFIYEKVSTLIRLYRSTIGSEIFLRLDNSSTKQNKVCQIKLIIPGNDLLASARSETFEQATLKAVQALKKQLIRHKRNRIS